MSLSIFKSKTFLCGTCTLFHLFGSDIEFVSVFTYLNILYAWYKKNYKQLNDFFPLSLNFVLLINLTVYT